MSSSRLFPPIRALALNAALYASLVILMLITLPTLFLPRRYIRSVVRLWGRYFVWLCRAVGNIGLEVRGFDKVQSGPMIVASKHQSIWETFALIGLFDDPCFILKRELTFIPLFGWYAIKARMLPVDRRGGGSVLSRLSARAKGEVRDDQGRQLLFFPEGTRRPAGAPAAYRQGVVHIYDALQVPCLPVALNSGLFWPRRSLFLRQGTIVVQFLEVIPAGLPREQFFTIVQERIETASDALLREGLATLGDKAPALPVR